MAQFAKLSFSHASYAALRPSYPPALYDTILRYHSGERACCVDLGCGHGVVARYLTAHFSHVIGIDPSDGMIRQAESSTSNHTYPNLRFQLSSAESLPFLKDESVDLILAAQAAHWFEYVKLWPEIKRYAYGDDKLGPYWSQPGRSIVQNKLRDIKPPLEDWGDIERIEYEPGAQGPRTGRGTMFLSKKVRLGECMNYIRTWSSFSAWYDEFQRTKREDGGEGDIVDEMFDEMVSSEPDWQNDEAWRDMVVEIEWGSGLLLARKRP